MDTASIRGMDTASIRGMDTASIRVYFLLIGGQLSQTSQMGRVDIDNATAQRIQMRRRSDINSTGSE